MRPPTLDERQAEAGERLRIADQVQNGHTPAGSGWCSCGKRLPCSIVLSCQQARAAALAELEQLQQLPYAPTELIPVIQDTDPPAAPRRRSALLRPRGRRRTH